MLRRVAYGVAIVSLLACVAQVAGAQGQRTPAPYKISAMRAMLFYDKTGTFSKDILADPNIALWNTIIGEGDSGGASSQTMVVVELSGRPEDYAPTRKIEFSATYVGRGAAARQNNVRRTADTGIFGQDGKFYAAFWLYDTGCTPVKLTARVTGQARPASLSKTINFRCGE